MKFVDFVYYFVSQKIANLILRNITLCMRFTLCMRLCNLSGVSNNSNSCDTDPVYYFTSLPWNVSYRSIHYYSWLIWLIWWFVLCSLEGEMPRSCKVVLCRTAFSFFPFFPTFSKLAASIAMYCSHVWISIQGCEVFAGRKKIVGYLLYYKGWAREEMAKRKSQTERAQKSPSLCTKTNMDKFFPLSKLWVTVVQMIVWL